MKCIDLRHLAGEKYKTVVDPSVGANSRDPFCLQIPCRFGHIYPVGGDRLGAWVESGRKAMNMLRGIPGLALVQDGDGEAVLSFGVDQFLAVSLAMAARARRRLSPERRKQLAQVGGAFQFGNARGTE